MYCERCNKRFGQLYEIFQGSSCQPVSVCANCIVGEYVPVFRPSCNKWNFGEVKAPSNSEANPKFELSFGIPESEREWLELESKPFEAYVSSHHRKVAIVLGSLRQLPEPPVVANEPWRDAEDAEDASNTLEGHLYHRPQPPKPPTLDSPLDVSFEDCPHTPIQASVYRTLCFDSPMHNAPASQFDNTTPVIGNGMNAIVSRTSTNQLPSSRHWTIDEDHTLIQSTLNCPPPFKWSKIAKLVPNRSGKQCRERYYNHLQPTLKHAEWSPVEDALLFYLHSRAGAKWATIAERLPGRSNNSVKNRYHNIHRRVEKEIGELDSKMLATASSTKIRVMEKLTNYKTSEESPTTEVIKLVVHSLRNAATRLQPIHYDFQFNLVPCSNESEILCVRCGLLIPSPQTGRQVCSKTGWCESCVSAPSYLCADILRLAHSERVVSSNRERYN